MAPALRRLLAAEQRSFLHRDRRHWSGHLERVRSFLGDSLVAADPDRPVLILGAGSGLEVPWRQAPPDCWGWDADPWSRVRTALRHFRWPPWVFEDLTGGMAGLEETARRCLREPWPKGQERPRRRAIERLAGLLPSQGADGKPLVDWIASHQPGLILSANVMGQFGVVAQRLLESLLGPWMEDPEAPDPLGAALDGWIARAVRAHLAQLAAAAAPLGLVYDRGVLHGGSALALGAWRESWLEQIEGLGVAEVEDPLCGVDPLAELAAAGRSPSRRERWLWPVAGGQTHLVEAIALGPATM